MTALRTPRAQDVLREQLCAIGYTLRMPMIIAAVLALLLTVALAVQVAAGKMEKHILAEPSSLPGIIGALLPLAIWAREDRFGPGFLWTLPVDRSRHALIKVLAGWLWLLAGLALYAFCQLVLVLVADGRLLPVKEMYFLNTPMPLSPPIDRAMLPPPIDRAMLNIVHWAPGPVVWVIPAATATATYLLASAFMLGIRHPLRLLVATVIAVPAATVLSGIISHVFKIEELIGAPASALSDLVEGSFGFEMLLTLRTWSLDSRAFLTTGERIQVWSAMPDIGGWCIAALLWTIAGLLALWAAVSQHRERRRA